MEQPMPSHESDNLMNWQDTRLWQLLDPNKPEVEQVKATIAKWLPEIQKILAQAGTSPTDFTLHDSQHSFRVAERMLEIIPDDVIDKLSTYEIALLLFAAYLHDIGMSPTQSSFSLHLDFLATQKPGLLSESQRNQFMRWLDNQGFDMNPKESYTVEEIRRLNYSLAQYFRSIHADTCDFWIDDNFSKEKLGTYAQWVLDLKILCRSHQQGYNSLISDIFNPKPVGSRGMVVHLRFLAIVLRVADILEFDPERTPEVIFRHRQINPASIVYWHKDHYINAKLEGGRLTISAEPPDAKIHNAIEIMTEEIETELQTARRIDDEEPLEISHFQEAHLPHHWHLLPDVRRDIRPKDNSYEYINGAFRPDTQKILHLLSGKELYGDEVVAIRELLQNSLDAVREQIAYERLQKHNPADLNWESMLGDLHEISVRLVYKDDAVWLVCTDDGAGMSKYIISNYLLISGLSSRGDIKYLERKCLDAGFKLNRTGQFGIGILSYFMIADHVKITTRRTALAEDTEANGWYFETDGIGSFGELRKTFEWRQGTEVQLKLKTSVINAIIKDQFDKTKRAEKKLHPKLNNASGIQGTFFQILCDYLNNTLVHTPCKIRIECDNNSVSMPKGWINTIDDRSSLLKKEILGEVLINRRILPRQIKQLIENMQSRLFWESFEGALPKGLGKFRILVPIFDLGKYTSPLYFEPKIEEPNSIAINKLIMNEHKFCSFPFQVRTSWKGMICNTNIDNFTRESEVDLEDDLLERNRKFTRLFNNNANVEIDWEDQTVGTLSISREEILVNEKVAKKVANYINKKITAYYQDVTKKNQQIETQIFTDLVSHEFDKINDYWVYTNKINSDTLNVGVIKYPFIEECMLFDMQDRHYFRKELSGKIIKWQQKEVSILSNIEAMFLKSEYSWISLGFIPDRVVCFEVDNERHLVPLTTEKPSTRIENKKNSLERSPSSLEFPSVNNLMMCEFPPNWAALLAVHRPYHETYRGSQVRLRNKNHPLHKKCDISDFAWFNSLRENDMYKVDLKKYEKEILTEEKRAAACLSQILVRNYSYWDELEGQSFLVSLWKLLFDSPEHHVMIYQSGRDAELTIFTSNSRTHIRNKSEINTLLAFPPEEWILKFE
jgi:hypothetical protein